MNINEIILEISASKLIGAAGLALAAGVGGAAYLNKKNKDAENRETNIKRATGAANIAANTYGSARNWGQSGNDKFGSIGKTAGNVAGSVKGVSTGIGRHLVNRAVGSIGARLIHGQDNIFNRAKKANTRAAITGGLDVASAARGLM